MATQADVFSLDEKIKKRFHLFDGSHEEKDDIALYEKIYELCFNEMIFAVEEKLDTYQQEILISQIEMLQESTLDEDTKQVRIIELILNSVENDPTFRFQLEARLDAFIENILA